MLTEKSKIFFLTFIIVASVISSVCLFLLKPEIATDGDAYTYLQAMNILDGKAIIPPGYVPNRILNTFVSMEVVIGLSKIFGSIEKGWLIMNLLFFFIINSIFYTMLRRIFDSDKVAFIAGLFFVANYGMIDFGVGYWMDIGSWTFYVASLYLVLRYWQTRRYRMLIYSAIAVGVGATFKEYSMLGVIPIAVAIIYDNWPRILNIFVKGIIPALISVVPLLLIYSWVFSKFGYSYADWLTMNQDYNVYTSRILEYIKSFGSLYTFLAVGIIGGIYFWVREGISLLPDRRIHIFVISVALSALPVFLWPGITQRISFITVPAVVLIAGFFFKKYEQYWWVWLPILGLYVAASFLMDSVLLPIVNLPF